MKTNIDVCSVFAALIILFCGCAQEIQETLYLGDAKINAPITTPPVHLNIDSQPGDITISPRFTTVNKNNMLATSDEMFTGSVLLPDSTVYRTSSKNINWEYNEYSFGVDLDIKISKGFSLFGGLSFSNDNLSGGNFGIGLFTNLTEPVVRFDLGLNMQKYRYDAVTVLDQTIVDFWGHQTKNRYIYHDFGEEMNSNPFLTLTFNSNNDSAIINYYLNVGYFLQQLLDFSPHKTYDSELAYTVTTSDRRPECTAGFIYLNPGISLSLNKQIRIVLSAKLLKETILQLDSGDLIIVPGLQMDFTL